MRTRLLFAAMVAAPTLTLAMPGAHPAPGAAPVAARPLGPGGAPMVTVKVPLMAETSGGVPVAKVGDSVIRIDELVTALAKTHEGQGAASRDLRAVLERLIDMRLVVLEAEGMGLDELPEVAQVVKEYEQKALGDAMKDVAIRDVKPDALAVESVYREMCRAYKARSVRFENVADAAAARGLLDVGRPFDEVAAKYVSEKKATDDGKAEVLPVDKLLPEVATALSALKPGEVTAPLAVQEGFALIRVEEVVYPEDPTKREALEADSLKAEQQKALRAFYRELVKKHAVLDKALIARLNFEAKTPGFAALMKDKRPLVRIKGEAPITVGDLAKEVRLKFFHGMDGPVREKKVNDLKQPLLDDLLARRLFLKEARERRLDESDAYRLDVAEFRSAVLFGKFAEKVIVPEIKVKESDIKAYYESHKAEYTFPAFYRLESLAFKDQKAAKKALDKLKAGTDFKWLRANADGVVPVEDSTLVLPNQPLNASTLASELVDAIGGAGPGEYRIFQERGQYHVVNVVDYTPPRAQEYADTREEISKKVFSLEMTKKVKEYVAKLRQAQPVTIYVTSAS